MGQKGRGAPKKGNRGTRDNFTATSSNSTKDKKISEKKSKPAKPSAPPSAEAPSGLIPAQDPKYQQRLLNLCSEAFASVLSSENFSNLLQEIKQALFRRDFAAAFGREDYLEAYAARWSPTRALCYAAVFQGISEHLDELVIYEGRVKSKGHHGEEDEVKPAHQGKPGDGEEENDESLEQAVGDITLSETRKTIEGKLKMLSIGGCAAEHIAFASHLSSESFNGTLTLLDSAPWSHVTTLTQTQLLALPQLPKYAGAAAKASNGPLIEPSQLTLTFSQNDVLSMAQDKLAELVGTEPLVITIMFTLNELYANGGIGKTTKFLVSLGQCLPHGSLLLVLDSPGSYSEATLGKEQKKYPMQWLLNHTLLDTDAKGAKWERLESHDSIWCRLPKEATYPIQLEDMRYQMHLYRINKSSERD